MLEQYIADAYKRAEESLNDLAGRAARVIGEP